MRKMPSPVVEKIRELFNRHNPDGRAPLKILEANMARDFRLSAEQMRKCIEELNLLEKVKTKKRTKQSAKAVQHAAHRSINPPL
jgi:hypothetical protein